MAYGEPTYGESGEVYTDKVRNSLAYLKSESELARSDIDGMTASITAASQTADEAKEIALAARGYLETPTDGRMAEHINDTASQTSAALSASYGRKHEHVVKPDGTGDYATLAAAVAAVTSGTIRLTDGTHALATANLSPATGVRIVGNGYNTVIRADNDLTSNIFEIQNPGVSIENLRIDGNKANRPATTGNGVKWTGAAVTSGAIRGCWVHDVPGYNIVAFPGVAGLIISDNQSYDAEKEGIELQGASYCTVTGNVVEGCGFTGIYLWNSAGDCGYNTVAGNTVRACGGAGIGVQDGAHDITITGNTVKGCSSYGIGADAGSGGVYPHSLTFAGNISEGNATHGIYLDAVARSVVTGNMTRANTQTGILLTGTSGITGAAVSDNNVYGNGEYGIYAKTIKGSIAGNTCGHNGREGIRVEASNYNAITGNVIFNNSQSSAGGYDGIRIGGGGTNSTYNTLTGNVSRDDQGTPTQRIGINEDSATSGPNIVVGNVAMGNGSGQITTRHASSVNANNLTA